LLSNRPYRSGLEPERVREILLSERGSQWDPELVELALEQDIMANNNI